MQCSVRHATQTENTYLKSYDIRLNEATNFMITKSAGSALKMAEADTKIC